MSRLSLSKPVVEGDEVHFGDVFRWVGRFGGPMTAMFVAGAPDHWLGVALDTGPNGPVGAVLDLIPLAHRDADGGHWESMVYVA